MKIKYQLTLVVESPDKNEADRDIEAWVAIENQFSKWLINTTKLVEIKVDNEVKGSLGFD